MEMDSFSFETDSPSDHLKILQSYLKAFTTLESFVFRTLAGLAFSGLYLTRGFGITAWTHALYDVAVLF